MLWGCAHREPSDPAKRLVDQGLAQLERHQWEEAEQSCRLGLEFEPQLPQGHNCLGLVAMLQRGDLDAAASHFKDALALDGDFAEAHNNLASTFLRRLPPDYEAASHELRAALEIAPGFVDARENLGTCLLRWGTVRGEQGDLEGRAELHQAAREQLIRLLQLDGTRALAHHHLGFIALSRAEYGEAELRFRRCLELRPDTGICAYNLGNVQLEQARCQPAIDAFVMALRSPEAAEVEVAARKNLAAAYVQCAQKDGAIRQFLEQLKLRPGDPAAHADLAAIYAERGDPEGAAREWRQAVTLDPTYCPPYVHLAEYAHQRLDTGAVLADCRAFLACAAQGTEVRWPAEVERCQAWIRALEVAPIP